MGGSGIPYGTLLRGYQDNTVGPYGRYPLGGRVMMKFFSELRFPFSDNPTVFGLIFAEMGNNWLSFNTWSLSKRVFSQKIVIIST